MSSSKPTDSKPTDAALKVYTQGRYRCVACCEFDYVALGDFAMPPSYLCPACASDAIFLTQARGMGINPALGVSAPGGMELRLGSIEKEDRGSRVNVGMAKPRKFPDCSFCDMATLTITGARDRADEMKRQHLREYKVFACPFGPGFHVQPMEE